MKDEFDVRVMKQFISMWAKMYSYLTNDGSIDKKAKSKKKCLIQREIRFEDYKTSLEKNETTMKLQPRFRSQVHNVFTEKF